MDAVEALTLRGRLRRARERLRRARERLRRARERRGLPVEAPRQLSEDEARDMERTAAYADHLIDLVMVRQLRDRVHRLRRGRAKSVAPVAVPQVLVLPIVDEGGVEVRKALPRATRREPVSADTVSAVRSMIETARTVQSRIGGRSPTRGGPK